MPSIMLTVENGPMDNQRSTFGTVRLTPTLRDNAKMQNIHLNIQYSLTL